MTFNFPDAPTLGQMYSGYTWDGEKWVGGPLGVPQDYVDAGDALRVLKAGDTMSGPLKVNESVSAFGYAVRTGFSGAFGTNTYNINWSAAGADLWIDDVNVGKIALKANADADYVNVTGDAMSGTLSTPTLNLGGVTTLTNFVCEWGTGGASPFYFDFHTSGTASDYDVRFTFNGGNATPGQGALTIEAAGGVNVSTTLSVPTVMASSTVQATAWMLAGSGSTGTYYYGNTGIYITFDGTHFVHSHPFYNITANATITTVALTVNNGACTLNQAAGTISQASNGSIMIQQGNQPFISFHYVGAFGANFGMDAAGDFYIGGWSFGGAAYKMWTHRDAPFSNASPGYHKLPSGMIIQWGYYGGGGDNYIWFPVAFAWQLHSCTVSAIGTLPGDSSVTVIVTEQNASYFKIQPRYVNNGGGVGIATQACFWMAMGY